MTSTNRGLRFTHPLLIGTTCDENQSRHHVPVVHMPTTRTRKGIRHAANLNLVCLGMSVVWASPIIIKLKDESQAVLSRPITDSEGAWIVSIGLITGVSALTYSGYLMDKLGRRNALLISYMPRFLFCFLAIFATEVWMVLLARCFAGIADLMTLSAVSPYISEVANKEIRGASGTMTQINSAVGMLIMFGVGPFVSYQTINILMTCIVGVTMIPLLFLPESPFFLYVKGDTINSIRVLTFLHGSEQEAREELQGYASSTKDEGVNKLALFKDRIIIKTFFMVLIISIGLQIIGYNAINFYLQTIFESANTTLSPEISSLIIGVIQLFACCCTFFLTKWFGRKQIIVTSLVGMFIGMVGLGIFFTLLENGTEITGFLNYLPLISVAIVIYGFNAGLGSLFWILVAELLYGPVRAIGMSLSVSIATLTAFIITLFFPALNSSIGASGTYWLFSAGCALYCLYYVLFVPETKGKTFAEIQVLLGRRTSVVPDGKPNV